MISFKEKQKTLFARIKRLRENATPSELAFKQLLDGLGVKYVFQKAFIKGGAYVIVDFYLPKPNKLCIEVDGKYHERQKGKDAWKDSYLKSRGLSVWRITNEEVETAFL